MVTGGTQGIGWALTRALANEGAAVYACGFSQSSLDKAEAVRATLPTAAQIHLSLCDVTEGFREWKPNLSNLWALCGSKIKFD